MTSSLMLKLSFYFAQMQLSEKELVRLETQGLLDFYSKKNQNGNNKRLSLYFQLFSGLLSHSLLETLVNG